MDGIARGTNELDVVVLGAGPAGLSAAARLAWVEAVHGRRALGLKVLLVEPCASLGGFARWRPVLTYSRESYFTRKDLGTLEEACSSNGVEIVHEEVELVTRHAGGFVVRSSGRERSAASVILASGLKRALEGEPELFRTGRLVFLPVRPAEPFAAWVRELEETAGVREIIVYGARRTRAMRGAMSAAVRQARVRWVEEEEGPDHSADGTVRGRIAGIGEDGDGVWLRLTSPEGRSEVVVRGDVLFIDSDSYVNGCLTTSCVAGLGLKTTNGFVPTDREMRTGVPGFFAAGDVTGPPLGIAKALGEGMVAGLSAYRYVHELRLGHPPDLFPFYPSPAGREEAGE